MDFFDDSFVAIINKLSPDDAKKILADVKVILLKKNELYFCEGDKNRKLFYVKNGILRGYFINRNGEEKTIAFTWENLFLADPNCFILKKTARLSWIAIEDCTIFELNFDLIEKLSKNNPPLLELIQYFMQKIMLRLYNRIEIFVANSPEERYMHFCKINNGLSERIPNKDLASYLGITPVSLSRIKKRISN